MDDVTAAKHVLDRAVDAGLGTTLRLRSGPPGLGVKGVLLRSRDGRRFLVAQLMDSMAGGLSLVVLPWMVLDAGGSRSLAGAAFLIATIPYLRPRPARRRARRPPPAAPDHGVGGRAPGRGRVRSFR